jgi:hypothetical protein
MRASSRTEAAPQHRCLLRWRSPRPYKTIYSKYNTKTQFGNAPIVPSIHLVTDTKIVNVQFWGKCDFYGTDLWH